MIFHCYYQFLFNILSTGDDSVLLKYLNPNMVAVTSAVHGSNGSGQRSR